MKNDSKNTLLAVGSVALDSVETPFGKVEEALGGSATFFSAAARFFAKPSVIAVVGEDFPKKHLKLLSRLGVNTRGIEIKKGGKTWREKHVWIRECLNCQLKRSDAAITARFTSGGRR